MTTNFFVTVHQLSTVYNMPWLGINPSPLQQRSIYTQWSTSQSAQPCYQCKKNNFTDFLAGQRPYLGRIKKCVHGTLMPLIYYPVTWKCATFTRYMMFLSWKSLFSQNTEWKCFVKIIALRWTDKTTSRKRQIYMAPQTWEHKKKLSVTCNCRLS